MINQTIAIPLFRKPLTQTKAMIMTVFPPCLSILWIGANSFSYCLHCFISGDRSSFFVSKFLWSQVKSLGTPVSSYLSTTMSTFILSQRSHSTRCPSKKLTITARIKRKCEIWMKSENKSKNWIQKMATPTVERNYRKSTSKNESEKSKPLFIK